MAIADYQNLIRFIEATKFNCAYELIVLFSAIKLKDEAGGFQREMVVDFFIDFYRIREKNKLTIKEFCDPFQKGDRDKTLRLINRNPISFLLKVGILKTFERFNYDIFKIIFNNEEKILSTIKERIKNYYSETSGDSKEIIEKVLLEWEMSINENIRSDALKKFVECYEKINLECLLKFLYQSYNLRTFNKLFEDFQINQREFNNYFNSNIKYHLKSIKSEDEEPQVTSYGKEQESKKYSKSYIRDLTTIFQNIREEQKEKENSQKKSSKKKD